MPRFISPIDALTAGAELRYSSRAAFSAAAAAGAIPAGAWTVQVNGYASEGDCSPHHYTWQADAPNANWSSACYVADASPRGGYWVISEPELDYRWFGAKGDKFAYNNFSLTNNSNQVTLPLGYFTTADIGKTIGFDVGGPAVAAWCYVDFLTVLYGSRSLAINGQTISFVTGTPSGFQVQIGGQLNDSVQAIAALINANPGTFGVTASAPVQVDKDNRTRLKLTAITAGAAGNSITVSRGSTEHWQMFVYYPTLWGGKAAGDGRLVTTIAGVSGAAGGAQTLTLATTSGKTATDVFGMGGTDDYDAIVAAHSMAGMNSGYATDLSGSTVGMSVQGAREILVTPDRRFSFGNTNPSIYHAHTNCGFLSSQPIPIRNGLRVKVAMGAAISPLPGFPSDRALFETAQSKEGPCMNWHIEGPGQLRGDGFADRAIWAGKSYGSQFSSIDGDLQVVGFLGRAVELGDNAETNKSYNNSIGKLTIQNKGDAVNSVGSNYPDSAGLVFSTSTDSATYGLVEVVGYRYGIVSYVDIQLGPSHVWTYSRAGPMKACYLLAGDKNEVVLPEADTPCSLGDANIGTCYFFWCLSGDTMVYNARGLASIETANDEVTFCYMSKVGARTTFFGAVYKAGTATLKRAAEGWLPTTEAACVFVGGLRVLGVKSISQTSYAPTELPSSGIKNYIDNGDFQVWRNTGDQSVFSATRVYGPERWYAQSDVTTGARVMRQVAYAGTDPKGYAPYRIEIEQTSAPSNGTYQRLAIRLPRDVLFATANKVFTLFCNYTLPAGTFPNGDAVGVSFNQVFGTGGSATVSISAGNIFAQGRTSIPVQLLTLAGKTVASDAYLEIVLSLPVSGTSTAFRARFGEFELVEGVFGVDERHFVSSSSDIAPLLQRYYEAGNFYAVATSAVYVPFKTTKHRTPTVAVSQGAASNVTVDGFLWTPATTGAATYTADASL